MNRGVDVDRAAPPDVPGLVVDRFLGAGRFGRVWQGLDLATGDAVAVRVGRAGPDPESAAREAALLRRLDHENVVGMRRMVDLPGGWRAVVTDLAAGGSLAALVDRRGELPEAEAATVAVGVARGLAHVHARGFVHGALTPREVLFDADGRPRLAGVGVAAVLAPPGDVVADPVYPSPAQDVADLGAVLRHALTGGVLGRPAPGRLAAVVDACSDPDPAKRPTAERVARLALDAIAPQPVTLVGPPEHVAVGAPVRGIPPSIARRAAAAAEGRLDELDAPDRPARGAVVRRAMAVGGAVTAALALLAGALVLALRHDPDPGRPVGRLVGPPLSAEPVAAPPPDAPALVTVLAAARARALVAGSESGLVVVDAPGSAAMVQDTALLRRMRASGVRPAGLTFAVSDVHVVSTSPGGTLVEARVGTSAYTQVRADGSVERRVPATPARTVRLTLVATPSGWRISSVT